MTWFKVDDALHSHPKWLAASPAARALWVTAGSWCAQHLTDGHVPRHVLPRVGGRPRDAAELVRLALWEPRDDGWLFHNWADFQPSAASVEAERAAARERQQKARDRARESRRDVQRDIGVTDAVSHGPPRFGPPDPTRPYVLTSYGELDLTPEDGGPGWFRGVAPDGYEHDEEDDMTPGEQAAITRARATEGDRSDG